MPPDAFGDAPVPAMSRSDMDGFVDIWGSDLESEAVEGLLRALNRMPFSVEDFDDLEGMAVTSCEVVDADSFRLHCYSDIKTLNWTVAIGNLEAGVRRRCRRADRRRGLPSNRAVR